MPEFFHTKLEYYYEGDFMIEKLQQPEKWHKTFILKCKKKNLMRVLFVLTNLQIGGAQIFVLRLARQLKKQFGINVYIYDAQPDYREILDNGDIKIYSFSENSLMRKFIWKINGLLSKLGFKNFQYLYNVFILQENYQKT